MRTGVAASRVRCRVTRKIDWNRITARNGHSRLAKLKKNQWRAARRQVRRSRMANDLRHTPNLFMPGVRTAAHIFAPALRLVSFCFAALARFHFVSLWPLSPDGKIGRRRTRQKCKFCNAPMAKVLDAAWTLESMPSRPLEVVHPQ